MEATPSTGSDNGGPHNGDVSTGIYDRAINLTQRGLHEVTAYLAGGLAVFLLWGLGQAGAIIARPLWIIALFMLVAAALGYFGVNYYEANPTGSSASVYVLAQSLAATIVIYLIGWGPALGIAYAYPIFNTTFPLGVDGKWSLMLWPTACVVGAQILVSTGAVTLLMTDTRASNGLAILDFAAFVFIALHATQLTQARESAERQLAFAATHDDLTDLVNRQTFTQHLEHTISLGRRQRPMAIMFCDLLGFKDVNDRYGHEAGDEVLTDVARRITSSVRHEDLVARFGGDEFVVALMSTSTPEGAEAAADRVLEAMAEPFRVAETVVPVGVSIGIAFAPSAPIDADSLVKEADAAMYEAKAKRRSTWVLHVV